MRRAGEKIFQDQLNEEYVAGDSNEEVADYTSVSET
jgi:hypothetical protein